MKVALDYDPALRGEAGVARYVRELVPHLLEADEALELHLVGRRSHGMPVHPRIRHVAHGMAPRRWRLTLLASLAVNRLVGVSLPEVDIFHATDFAFPPAGARIRRVVVTIHDLSTLTHASTHTLLNRVALWLFLMALRMRRYHVITPSEAAARAVVRHLAYPASLVTPISLGVNTRLVGPQ
jgi:hypothetical protein